MIDIHKQREPADLVEWRMKNPENYSDYTSKDKLKSRLVDEQKGLCCYCMSRISPDSAQTQIEHWASQSEFRTERLAYGNLLACCNGEPGAKRKDQHCDEFKGSLKLSRNPANPATAVEHLIQYSGDGRIKATDADLNRELDSVLNLNTRNLVRNRFEVLRALAAELRVCRIRNCDERRLRERWRRKYQEGDGGLLPPYAGVIRYKLRNG